MKFLSKFSRVFLVLATTLCVWSLLGYISPLLAAYNEFGSVGWSHREAGDVSGGKITSARGLFLPDLSSPDAFSNQFRSFVSSGQKSTNMIGGWGYDQFMGRFFGRQDHRTRHNRGFHSSARAVQSPALSVDSGGRANPSMVAELGKLFNVKQGFYSDMYDRIDMGKNPTTRRPADVIEGLVHDAVQRMFTSDQGQNQNQNKSQQQHQQQQQQQHQHQHQQQQQQQHQHQHQQHHPNQHHPNQHHNQQQSQGHKQTSHGSEH